MSFSVSQSPLGKESIKYRRIDFNGTPKYNSPVSTSGYSSNNVELCLVVHGITKIYAAMLRGCDATAFLAVRCCHKRPPGTTPVTTSRRKRKPARSFSCGRACPDTVTALTLIVLFLTTVAFPSSSASHGHGSPPGSSPTMVLRVRMPDGAVKRVTAAASDTVDSIMDKLGVGGAGEGLSTDGGELPERTTSVASLGLRNGDFLYVKSDAATRAAAKSKAQSLGRIKASMAESAKTWDSGVRGNKFVPFPDHARPPPPLTRKRMKTWKDLEAMQAQTFSLKPQKNSNVKKIIVEQSGVKEFVRYLRETGYRSHRYALLFGRISTGTKDIKVEAMYEPPQASAVDSSAVGDCIGGAYCYDASALTEAAAVVAQEDGDGEREGLSEAAEDVLRAVRVAELLGLRLVGWCLSHDKRGHFMAARDVVTAAAIQLMVMTDKGRDEGVLVATVAVSVNATDGEVSTEAFSVSNQTVQMFSEGLLAEDQPEPTSDRVMTTAVVREGSTETRTPETLGLVCNVAIVQHQGVLQTRFPPANRAKPPSLSDLKKCLFGRVKAEGSTGKQKQPSFLKRLSDFQILMYLSRQMGFSRDFEELCAVVKKRESKSAALRTLKLVLESLCDASGE